MCKIMFPLYVYVNVLMQIHLWLFKRSLLVYNSISGRVILFYGKMQTNSQRILNISLL